MKKAICSNALLKQNFNIKIILKMLINSMKIGLRWCVYFCMAILQILWILTWWRIKKSLFLLFSLILVINIAVWAVIRKTLKFDFNIWIAKCISLSIKLHSIVVWFYLHILCTSDILLIVWKYLFEDSSGCIFFSFFLQIKVLYSYNCKTFAIVILFLK